MHTSRICAFALSVCLLLAGLGPHTAQAAAPIGPAPIRYVEATGHTLRDPFLSFYTAHGGAAIFGNPLTEVVAQDGIAVQYFDFARFEWHNDHVVLASLGRTFAAPRESEPALAWLAESSDPERQFVAESGHTLGGAFGWFWQINGGVAVFGYPISEEFEQDGQVRQFFERALFTYDAVSNQVVRAPLGRWLLEQQPDAAAWTAPVPAFGELATVSMAIPVAARQNVALAAKTLDGQPIAPGQEFSFLKSIGTISSKQGYVSGVGIVNGQLVQIVGGGVCYVSTALYRAVWTAGLPITEQHGHSIMLQAFSSQPGLDAAIETSGPDFRWRNDTGDTVYIRAALTGDQLTITLWGTHNGNTVTTRKPVITNRQSPGPAEWIYDAALASGETRQLFGGSIGQRVQVERVLTRADGSVVRTDRAVTTYRPTPPLVTFGPGVIPPAGVSVIGYNPRLPDRPWCGTRCNQLAE